jgi:hypothetical protein
MIQNSKEHLDGAITETAKALTVSLCDLPLVCDFVHKLGMTLCFHSYI